MGGMEMRICKVDIDREAVNELERLLQLSVYDALSSTIGTKLSFVDFRCLEFGEKNSFLVDSANNRFTASVVTSYRKIALDNIETNLSGGVDVDKLKRYATSKLEDMIVSDYRSLVNEMKEYDREQFLINIFENKPLKVVLEELPKLNVQIENDHAEMSLYFKLGTSLFF